MLVLLLCSSLGVHSHPQLHGGHWAGSITAHLVQYSCSHTLHLLWMEGVHPKGCTWINLLEYQRPFEKWRGKYSGTEGKSCKGDICEVHFRAGLCLCACMRLNGSHSASLLCLHLPGAIPIEGLSLGPNPKLIGEVKKGSNIKI